MWHFMVHTWHDCLWMPHWSEGQFLLFPSKALSRITPLSVFKKLEDQASNRKIRRKEAHPLCSPRRKQELDPAFRMPHPILHIDDIYSYNANMRNARALILTDTRVHMFFNAENPKSLWRSGRKYSATPTTKPVTGLFVTSLFFHKKHWEAPTKLNTCWRQCQRKPREGQC